MFISLGVAATAWGSLLNGIVDVTVQGSLGSIGDIINSYALAALIVSFPVFAILFLRLGNKEESEPALLRDASRRRGMQITLVISFVVAIGKLISYLYSLLNTGSLTDEAASYLSSASRVSGVSDTQSAIGDFLHLAITFGIAATIFVFYWYKLHRREA